MRAREPCTTLRRVAERPWSSTTGGPSPACSPSSVMLPAPGSWRSTWNWVVSTAPHCHKELDTALDSGECPPVSRACPDRGNRAPGAAPQEPSAPVPARRVARIVACHLPGRPSNLAASSSAYGTLDGEDRSTRIAAVADDPLDAAAQLRAPLAEPGLDAILGGQCRSSTGRGVRACSGRLRLARNHCEPRTRGFPRLRTGRGRRFRDFL